MPFKKRRLLDTRKPKTKELNTPDGINKTLGNLREGDVVVLDIDETLLYNATKKYGEIAPVLTEKTLLKQLAFLRETNRPVILLTARRNEAQTITQLALLGLPYDALLFAPNEGDVEASHDKKPAKGEVLIDYLLKNPELIKKTKRLIVIDDREEQLEAIIAAKLEHDDLNEIELKPYQYQPVTKCLSSDTDDRFPSTLDGIKVKKSLGGGTSSTYWVEKDDQFYVLKHGASEAQIKVEILMNAVYQCLGIPVAKMQAYRALPHALAKKINLPHTATTVQLSEYITSAPMQDAEAIQSQALQDFVVHAFLGNIDAKPDNFIQNEAGDCLIIDSGANFVFRARGELRDESEITVSEIESMREARKNSITAEWFSGLTHDDIKEQVKNLIEKRSTLEKTLWNVSNELELSAMLQQKIISGFSHRLDNLAMQYGFATQQTAKRDKAAMAGQTAAGVMTLQRNEKGELCVLLSKRVHHNWSDNFGGASDDEDMTLEHTAQREVFEESNGLLAYTNKELSEASFHDIVTKKDSGCHLYRMYFIERNESLELDKLKDPEHTQHDWVALKQLNDALERDEKMMEEGIETIKVKSTEEEEIILFPPLYEMLKQAPVKTRIKNLLNPESKKRVTRTQGVASTLPEQGKDIYRPITSVKQVHDDIVHTQLNKAGVLAEIKHRDHHEDVVIEDSHHKLSQSELHLKAIMGDDFDKDADIEKNVGVFVNNDAPISDKYKKTIIEQAVSMIEQERARPDMIYFYHACNSDIAYAYQVYSALYKILEANHELAAFRADHALFHKCLNIQQFIDHFSKNRHINNYIDGYMQCAISSNLFLFGNHNTPTSNSIDYYIKNTTKADIDIKKMFDAHLKSMGVSDLLINLIAQFAQYNPQKGQGALYQIGLPADIVDEYAYTAGSLGCLQPLIIDGKKSTKITEVLEQIRGGHVDKAYIERLQARVMMPFDAPISKTQYQLGAQPEEKVQKSFDQKLDKLCEALAFDILRHQNQFNKLNSKTGLKRYIPEILSQAGVAGNILTVNDELLAELVNAEDFDSIKVILEQFPHYKEKTLTIKNKSYERTACSRNKKKTLLELLLEKPGSSVIIREIYGENFYEGKLDQLDFFEVLGAIPHNKQILFLENNDERIQTTSQLTKVLERLSKDSRLVLATRHEGKIQNGIELGDVLFGLPEASRLDFAKRHEGKIQNGEELGYVLFRLPEASRLDFATQHEGKIQNCKELSSVLFNLPEASRLDFATHHEGKIQNC